VSDIATLRRVLGAARRIAVVGLSDDVRRPSHLVARYLQAQGYRIVPVNPRHGEILGETCHPDLLSIPEPLRGAIDIVDVFRRSEDVLPVASQAVAIGARVLWLQLGVVSAEARRLAEAAGLTVIMDRCLKIEHARLAATTR
jgi:predicted CoA-binding protein